MHIVHICLNFNTIIEYQELALAREQIRLGHQVTVITSDWNPNFKNYQSIYNEILGDRYIGTGTFIEEGITIYRLKLINNPSIFTRLKGARKLIKMLNPDLVFCHNFEIGILLFQAMIAKCKIIVDSHYMPIQYIDNNWIQQFKHDLSQFFNKAKGLTIRLRKNIICIGVTEESVLNLTKSLCPVRRVNLVPLAADTNCFYPAFDIRKKTREKLGLHENEFLIIFTGKIQENKGVHHIINAIGSLAKEGINKIKLLLVGNGPEEYINRINGLISTNKLKSSVHIINFSNRTELNMYFNAAEVAVYPNEVSISHLEAMSVGLPIIIENLPGIQHRLSNNNGYGISNEEELRDRIRQLYLNEKLRKQMGVNSRMMVTEALNWKAINAKLMDI